MCKSDIASTGHRVRQCESRGRDDELQVTVSENELVGYGVDNALTQAGASAIYRINRFDLPILMFTGTRGLEARFASWVTSEE